MPAQNIHVISEVFKNLEEVSEQFAILQKQLRYLQEHIDVENIISKSLTAEVIAANAITANEIQAGAVTADKISVNQLSAISANLGTIIAGLIRGIQIFGSYIATSENYPRTEMNAAGNFLSAISSPGTYASLTPTGSGLTPALVMAFANAVKMLLLRNASGTMLASLDFEDLILSASRNMLLQAPSGNINLSPNGSIDLAPSGDLKVNGNEGVTGVVYVSLTNGGPANIPIYFSKGLRVV